MKVFLLGKHRNRVPLYYPVFKRYFCKYIEYVDKPKDADILILGFVIDILDNIELITESLSFNKHLKIIVLSEEPLWDTLWGGDYLSKKQIRSFSGHEISFFYINYSNSNIFDFDKIPYFVLTNDDYIVRYHNFFNVNKNKSKKDILQHWKKAKYEFAFIAEKRKGDKYNIRNLEHNIYGLCDFRTRVTEFLNSKNTNLIEGKNWEVDKKRQDLPDWHLDKLSKVKLNARYISALENTHQKNYISEKIFDSYCCLGIPLYFSDSSHNIKKIISDKSFINLFDFDFEEGSFDKLVSSFDIDSYMDTIENLSDIFSDYQSIQKERESFVVRVIHELKKISG